MATLLEQLDQHYPGWRKAHTTPESAAVEIGLLDADDDYGYAELDFNDDSVVEFDAEIADYA